MSEAELHVLRARLEGGIRNKAARGELRKARGAGPGVCGRGAQIDQAVTGALQAAEALEADHDAALGQWRLQVERAKYQADRAERRYRQSSPSTGSSPAAWSATAKRRSACSPRPRPSWPCASASALAPSRPRAGRT